MSASHRRELETQADAILAANDNRPRRKRIRHEGGRPALNWLAKHDPRGAACLWRIARARLPLEPGNDNSDPADRGAVDRRKDGRPRGRRAASRDLEGYIALPSAKPRLGDPEPVVPVLRGWFAWFDLRPQRDVFDFHDDCRFGFLAPGVARGTYFLGAASGLGQAKVGRSRGDVRRVDAPSYPTPPAEIDAVIESIIARATVAGVGEALGARGGYADRRGAKALRAAAGWAVGVVGAKSPPEKPEGE